MKTDDFTIKVIELSYHRNGVGGRGFYAVYFLADIDAVTEEEGKLWNLIPGAKVENAKWFAAVTDTPGECYVICVDLLSTRGVRFGGNSWRGDRFEPHIRKAIEDANDVTSGSIRVGPFCIPTE